MTNLLKSQDTTVHPSWCDPQRCVYDPARPGYGEHLSAIVRNAAVGGDITLDMTWTGTDQGIHLIALEVAKPGNTSWMTLAQARALHAQLGDLLAGVTPGTDEHDATRLGTVGS